MCSRLPSRSPTVVLIWASASLMGPVLDYQSKTSSPEADCVQVVTLDFVRPADQILDVVVLRMDVTAGERVRPARREHPDQAGRKLRRSPRRVVGEIGRA